MTLDRLRRRKKLTQTALAKAVPCEQTTVSQLELGKLQNPRYSTVAGIARVLETTPDVIFAAILKANRRRQQKTAAA